MPAKKSSKPKLNPNARKWVKALRSGKYKQGRDYLCQLYGEEREFCCLGVACELFIRSGNKLRTAVRSDGGNYVEYGGNRGIVPGKVREWLGLRDNLGEYVNKNGLTSSLADLNDRGKSFENIADIIESQPEGLFA